MIASKYWLKYFATASSEAKPPKKSLENIELAFVEVDAQLGQLAEANDLAQVKRFVPAIQKQLFELYYLCVGGLNVGEFASHEPGHKTPLNSECC